MIDVIEKPRITSDQQIMLAAWQQHTYAEFILKDADAALATMTEKPYVFLVGSGVMRVGRAAVHEFYANKFLPETPAGSRNHLSVADIRQRPHRRRDGDTLYALARYGLDTSGAAAHKPKSRIRPCRHHPV